MKLRPALVCDAEAIGHIRVSAWQAAYEKFMPKSFLAALDSLEHIDSWRNNLAKQTDGFMVCVAEVDASVEAFSIIGKPRYPTTTKVIELWALNVHPSLWRQGIGRALTLRAVDTASFLGFQSVELWCIHGNFPARAAYESCGFSLTGQERSSSTLTGYPLQEVLYAKAL